MSLDRLATLYQAQGKYADAEPLYKRELVNFEKSLGPEHPQLAKSLANYAALLRKTGRLQRRRQIGRLGAAVEPLRNGLGPVGRDAGANLQPGDRQ